MVQHIADALSLGSLDALIALGIALVFGVMHLINFAYGELITIGGYTILATVSLPWPLILIMVFVVVVAAALAMERVAFRPVRGANPTTLLVTSFALSVFLQNLVVIIEGRRAKSTSFGDSLGHPFFIAGSRIAFLSVVSIVLTVLLVTLLGVLLRRTWIGTAMRAAAADFTMARLLGVGANSVIAAAFAVSGVLAAGAAIVLVATTGTLTFDMGVQPVLIGFVATVIGGMGSLTGAAVGGFVLGALTVGIQEGLPLAARGYTNAVLFAVVIAILLVRPGGLVGGSALEERV